VSAPKTAAVDRGTGGRGERRDHIGVALGELPPIAPPPRDPFRVPLTVDSLPDEAVRSPSQDH
jgi:hypothetical protein